jgi:DNA polymerase-3 subunit alpha
MYPLEFLTTLLNNCNGAIDKIKGYVQYLKTKGIKLLPPSINDSQFEFSVHHKDIVFGLSAVKGLGISVITKIITAREKVGGAFKDYQHAIKELNDNGVGLKTIETLIKIGAFDCVLNGKTRY